MATIRKRTSAKGVVSYYVEVRIHAGREVIGRKSATFASHKEARAWASRTEVELSQPDALPDRPAITVQGLIRDYLTAMEKIQKMGRTRRETLTKLSKLPFFAFPAAELTTKHLTDYCTQRRLERVSPSTVMSDMVLLRGPFRDAKTVLGLNLDDRVFAEVMPTLRRLGLVTPSGVRNRRPEAAELDRLLAAFRKRAAHSSSLIPMADLVEFALASCMRQSEITNLKWADLDEKAGTVIVRERKHPTRKLDQVVPLLPLAMNIILRQPRDAERIFPYDAASVSTAFTRVCAQAGVEDLRFHDLRREGITRLIETGLSVSEVATISGHLDLDILHRVYTAISPAHVQQKWAQLSADE